jgi:hypothetical protein
MSSVSFGAVLMVHHVFIIILLKQKPNMYDLLKYSTGISTRF